MLYCYDNSHTVKQIVIINYFNTAKTETYINISPN